MFYALILINNHIISCVNWMLSQLIREIVNLLPTFVHILEVTLSPSDRGNKRWYHVLTKSLSIELWLNSARDGISSIIS